MAKRHKRDPQLDMLRNVRGEARKRTLSTGGLHVWSPKSRTFEDRKHADNAQVARGGKAVERKYGREV